MYTLLRIVLLISLIFFPGCENRQGKVTPSGRIIKIGVIGPRSGPDKKTVDSSLLGAQVALQMTPYLKNGDKIEFVVEDNQGAIKQTLTALDKLSGKDDVAAVLLVAASDIVLGVVPYADQYKVPIMALNATHPDITENNNFVIQLGFDDNYQGRIAALYVRDEMLIDRVAVISDPYNAHFSYLANAFLNEFTAAGGTVEENLPLVTESTDLTGILKRLMKKDVQLLYLAIPPDSVIKLVREARNIGWSPKIMGSDGLMSKILLQHEEDKELLEGVMATDFYSTGLPRTEYGKRAIRIFNKIASVPRTTYAGLGIEGTSLIINAMDSCGNEVHRSCVNLMLHNTKEFEGLFGKLSIHKNGKTERPIFVNIIKGQAQKFLVKVY